MDILEQAKILGLNNYEAKVYLALIERDSLSVSEVSKISSVPRSRVYDILDSLVSNGLATFRPGKFKKYSAANPAIFEGKLINRIQEKYVEQKNTVEKAASFFKKRFESKIDNGAHPLDYIEILKDPFQIRKRFSELIDKAEKEVLGFAKPPFSAPFVETIEERANTDIASLARGVIHKAIYEIPTEKDEIEQRYNEIERSIKVGEQAKVIAELPMKMAIFDEKIALFQLIDHVSVGQSFTLQIVEHPALAKSLKMLFNHVWEQAQDYHVLEDILKKM
jgi:HTH-type transcriptional regulator, sugar sensing transcriptional regulator